MSDDKKFGTEARSKLEIPEQTQLEIQKVLEQCGIDPDSWKQYNKKLDNGID